MAADTTGHASMLAQYSANLTQRLSITAVAAVRHRLVDRHRLVSCFQQHVCALMLQGTTLQPYQKVCHSH
jgi:hypothetical protein